LTLYGDDDNNNSNNSNNNNNNNDDDEDNEDDEDDEDDACFNTDFLQTLIISNRIFHIKNETAVNYEDFIS